MAWSQLTEKTIRQYSSAQSFQRGSDYYHEGAVTSLVRRGVVLQAEVEGSEVLPYLVCCTFDSDEDLTATCTCPYDWGGWCKHIVATCLACIHQPEMIEERPPLDSQLASLKRDQLQLLLLKLAEQEPSLVGTIEREITSLGLTSPESVATAPTPIPLEDIEIDPAEYIINKGQTKYYGRAINWLEKARTTYRALGREEQWQTYLNGLLSLHWRKSKLVPMLKALG